MVKFGKRLCELSPISRWNPGRNSLTIQLQLGIPGRSRKPRKFGGLTERGPKGDSTVGEGGEPHFAKCYADFCLVSH